MNGAASKSMILRNPGIKHEKNGTGRPNRTSQRSTFEAGSGCGAFLLCFRVNADDDADAVEES